MTSCTQSGLVPRTRLITGVLQAPVGTRMPFNQASPPVGWTQDTTTPYNDCSMRANNSSPSTGGSTAWSSWNFGGTFSLNAFTISVAQLPSHSHGVNDPTHTHTLNGCRYNIIAGPDGDNGSPNNNPQEAGTIFNSSSDSANLSSNNNGSGAAIQPTYTTPQVKYTDSIIGVKA